MAAITASDWYREHKDGKSSTGRDHEADAAAADAVGEKDYG